MCDEFLLHKVYHEVQAAMNDMRSAQTKMESLKLDLNEMYHDIDNLQRQFDAEKAAQDQEWASYNEKTMKLKTEIGYKIACGKEAAALEERMRIMANDAAKEPATAEVLAKGAEFFGRLNLENMTERDALIHKKRNLIRPDNSRYEQILDKLKNMRAEHAEILEKYHAAKNDFTLKKTVYDRLNAKYNKAKNPDDNTFGDDILSSRPRKMFDEGLLVKAEIPEEYWGNCNMERRADGKVDIYYGGSDSTTHGHVVLNGDTIEYSRRPA